MKPELEYYAMIDSDDRLIETLQMDGIEITDSRPYPYTDGTFGLLLAVRYNGIRYWLRPHKTGTRCMVRIGA